MTMYVLSGLVVLIIALHEAYIFLGDHLCLSMHKFADLEVLTFVSTFNFFQRVMAKFGFL